MAVKSIFDGSGYLMNDDRASGGQLDESDMMGCGHCQRLLKKKLWCDDGGFCHCCWNAICGPCADRMLTRGCENFLAKLESSLEKEYRRNQNVRMLGL